MADAEPPTVGLSTGRTLGDFQILRKIGEGGMGQVYLARQLSLKRDVALKLLRNDLTTNPTALKRFEAEAHAVARLNHPNIVQVYHLGENDGLRYMALEFVEGRNLRDYLDRRGPPDLPVTINIVRQVALALQKAHEQGIVHRDIKPENILVTRKVEVKVTDFGLSRFFAGETPALNLTQSGVTLGTPLYMSPEQVQGLAVDHRSDIYSFGVTCYHLLAGEPPFRGQTAFDVAMKHVHSAARPLAEFRTDLPPDLCAMVHKMMAKDPADRYASTRELLRDLARVREGIGLGLKQAGATALAATSPSIALTQSGGTISHAAVPSGPTLALSALPAAPIRRGRWWLLALGCAAAAAGAALVHGQLHPAPEASFVPGSGLPDVRPPLRPTTARERELLALLDRRDTAAVDRITLAVDLGLLLIHEGRWDEAEARFATLGGERLYGAIVDSQARMAGRLGQAIVLAHRDQPAESNKAFEEAMAMAPKGTGPGGKVALQSRMRSFLRSHAPLSQAVSEALDRNAANLKVKELTPRSLEQLRHARELMKPTEPRP